MINVLKNVTPLRLDALEWYPGRCDSKMEKEGTADEKSDE